MSEDWRNRLLALKDELEAVSETGEASSAVVELDPTATLCIDCASKSENR